MARIEHDVVVDLREALEALDHQGMVAAGKIGAPAAVEEQGVARHQLAAHHEALAPRGVTRRVDELDLDVADAHDVARLVPLEM